MDLLKGFKDITRMSEEGLLPHLQFRTAPTSPYLIYTSISKNILLLIYNLALHFLENNGMFICTLVIRAKFTRLDQFRSTSVPRILEVPLNFDWVP